VVLADDFDLAGLQLSAGEGRRLDLRVGLDPVAFGGQRYIPEPAALDVRLDISRMMGNGYALRIQFQARLGGPCMRCLEAAAPTFDVEAREVDQPGGGEELDSPYVNGGLLDVAAWARDALVLALPAQILCRPDCAGLCAVCGEHLNDAGGSHDHGRAPDPRWAALSRLHLE
jgi:uncharacterized protein